MRRMITESDVEKLDSIQPSEMEKLGAMQDPKTATAGQILTADGNGKAVFKDNTGGGSGGGGKQYYQHTVHISMYGGSNKPSGYIAFTAYSDSETPATNYQQLYAMFGGANGKIAVSGIVNLYSDRYSGHGACLLDLTSGVMGSDNVGITNTGSNSLQTVALEILGREAFGVVDDVRPL